MLRTKPFRYTMFGLLYFSQGAIMSYFAAFNAIYLITYDLSMTQIGLVSAIAMIPLVLKIFIGMLSDRVNLLGLGFRKPYILLGLLLQSACLAVIPLVNPGTHFPLFVILAFLTISGMALYDTCTDGLALDTTPAEEQGTIQGIMVAGRAAGVVIISAITGVVAQTTSWHLTFWVLAAVTLFPLPFVLAISEHPRPGTLRFEWRAFSAFRKPAIILLALLGALYSLIINGVNEITNPFINAEFGISLSVAGFLTTVWGVGVIIGGLAGGFLVDRIGQKRSVISALFISLGSILLLSAIFHPWAAWLFVILFGFAYGLYETVYFALSMQATDRRIAASMFSILMAIANLGTGIGLGVTGALVDILDYRWTLVALAMINLLALPMLPVIFPNRQSILSSDALE
ncbi:MAG TPA: MFS transporter [Anaerolineaceae bacterium]